MNVNFGDPHGWKPVTADVACGHQCVDHERDVVAAVRQGDDFRLVPHVAQPLAACQIALLGPGKQTPECRLRCTIGVGLEHPHVSDGARWQVAQTRHEPIRIGADVQRLAPGQSALRAQRAVEACTPGVADGVQIEAPRCLADVLSEAAREIGRGRKAAVQRHLGQGLPFRVGHQVRGAFQAQPLHKLVRRLTQDNNASCAIGPFIRLFVERFSLDTVRNAEVGLAIEGVDDGYRLDGVSRMRQISRDPLDLVAQTCGAHHQYPDGCMLFLGTMFSPIQDRDAPGAGFTHHLGDRVTISSPALGALVNTVQRSDQVPPWTFGVRALIANLAGRGLLQGALA